ncbi:helicase, putative [Cellulomonas flavigena DSM 20109]|uniref:Helicase, putative n=2 Tax=Cellulomonas flavigena TaxID=1711 RepID=D5UHS9_CELFN|nr:helicase, putative [Cellulomonas flavigena DSM 20109]
MASIEQQVRNADDVICQNIAHSSGDRGLLAQNLLSQLRNLVEGLTVWAHLGDPSTTFHYDQVAPAIAAAKATAKYRLLSRFHSLLQASASHYTLEADPSERLMLKYYEYLIRTRDLSSKQLGVPILANLEDFPVDLDPSLREYHTKIAERIDRSWATPPAATTRRRFYIHSSRPFFVSGRIYYELTISPAHNRTNKFDRTIAFTDIDVTDKYASHLDLAGDSINVLGTEMPILIARSWEVSIRPCEFDNFSRLLGRVTRVSTGHSEYRNLMRFLTDSRSSLLDLIDMQEQNYQRVRTWTLERSSAEPQIFPTLDEARTIIQSGRPGSRILRYLMLRMRNEVVKAQYNASPCAGLSGLRLSWSCKPFDTMPFCTSPRRHNAAFSDLSESLDWSARRHELLARRVRSNVEQHGSIYTPAKELEGLGDLDELIRRHNALLPPGTGHAARRLRHENGHVFIIGYEDDTVSIIEKLRELVGDGAEDYTRDVQDWLSRNPSAIDDPAKEGVLENLFASSNVALISGAAGTGKSTLIHHIANYFADSSKLFLAHTNPAVDNLKRRVSAPNSEYSTIARHVNRSGDFGSRYDLVIIDECSTVDNASVLEVLTATSFDHLVLVGDVYQIESIQFGNWFSLARSYIPQESVFELTKPFRTNDRALLTLWDRVRNLDDRIEESLAQNGFSTVLGETLFQRQSTDEVILCLNYDGLYGINNVNRFLQASNPNRPVQWDAATYKVNDPILFNETDRFRPVIFNNMKGTIVGIERGPGRITFDVSLEHEVTADEVSWTGLRHLGGSVVQFDVFDRGDSDDDDDSQNTLVPFQIAYAVSIHKAQGLEYDSVKVVITDANEERISHSIFYTAITRARRLLKVFWTPETQHRVLSRLAIRENVKDESLLKARRGLTPTGRRPRLSKERPPL